MSIKESNGFFKNRSWMTLLTILKHDKALILRVFALLKSKVRIYHPYNNNTININEFFVADLLYF